jgi:ceramide glucosyltransferase
LSSAVLFWTIGVWWLATTVVYVATIFLPRWPIAKLIPKRWPAVSVVVPVKGIDAELDSNLDALFRQSYAEYELLFMVAEPSDLAIAIIEAAIARHPAIDARLIVGDSKVSANPKVNNLAKSEQAARHPLLLMCDANIAVQSDMLRSMVALLRPEVGLVSTVPIAVRPGNFIGELECAMFNGFSARWLVAAGFLGRTAAVGKVMLIRKADLARIGGIPAMAAGLCEDSALATALSALGLRVIAAPEPTHHPVGPRRFRDFWQRHLRWHCCRRCHHQLTFLVEPFAGSMGAMLAGTVFWSYLVGTVAMPGMMAFLVGWWGMEAYFLHRQGWPFTWRSPIAWLVRDLLLPVLWVSAATTQTLMWRGSRMDVRFLRPVRCARNPTVS